MKVIRFAVLELQSLPATSILSARGMHDGRFLIHTEHPIEKNPILSAEEEIENREIKIFMQRDLPLDTSIRLHRLKLKIFF